MNKYFTGAALVALTISLVANVLLYYRYSSNLPVVRVDGGSISRKEFRDTIESQYGKRVLRNLVLGKIVTEQAKKAGVMPSPADVDARVAEISRKSPQLVAESALDPVAMQSLRYDTAMDMALDRLRSASVSVSDAEVADFYARNRDLFTSPMAVQTSAVVAENPGDAALAEELLRQDVKPYVIARRPRLQVVGVGGFRLDLSHLSSADATRLQTLMGSMHPGDVATTPLDGSYLVFKVQTQQRREALPLSAVRDRAEQLARLEKAPPADVVLARLFQNAHPVFEANEYEQYFSELEEPAPASTDASQHTQTASAGAPRTE